MKRNEIYVLDDDIIRILFIKDDDCLVINCNNNSMPVWKSERGFQSHSIIKEEDLFALKGIELVEDERIVPERKKIMYERYTMIAPVLPFVGDEKTRSHVISVVADDNDISKQTIRNWLKRYLIFQNIQVLLPKEREYSAELTKDQKNMRWSLNKYFYTFEKNSLHTAYVKMLKEELDAFEEREVEEYQTLEEMIKTAKNMGVDIIEYLKGRILIEEVAVE